ncbi:glycosyltransferase family 4 protein [Paludisphaera mucosa]|uniref:Glycosyltransferase family 4 protein n=1 Tax=Paludisphaera mucosa TaxID=3030827 RepID=A0ABT6F8Z8_9BACT|nr:glycosyltransferase family 4 protein [Paludisphaera mucosa]MDG3004058.1 glycosyltransferase family 4 protein [Paludisphaera mucosa]
MDDRSLETFDTAPNAAHWLATRSQGPPPSGSAYLHAPSSAFQSPGGGENQLIQTGRHLEALDVPVRLFSPWTDRLDHARLLHLFGMSREGLELARAARARRVPIVVSPICWYEPRALWALEPTAARKLGAVGAWAMRRAFRGLPGWRRELLATADRVLPNSDEEADQLVRLFGVDRGRIRVVPNGVLPEFGWGSPRLFRERVGDFEFVLFVGRIEPRKNPLGVIRAARRLGLPLVVVGEAPPQHENYERQCRREGGDRVVWLEGLDHHDPLLTSTYAAARVFALCSWFETPGLAALEAALSGAAVVVTPHGSTRSYFGDRATYARPWKVDEIGEALSRAWREGPRPGLAAHVASNYLWDRVAKLTAEVYDQVAD